MSIDVSLTELARRLRTGEIGPLEVIEATLDRLDRVEPHVNAFITRRDDAALDEARAREASNVSVADRGALYGVPVAIKDNIAVAGLPVTAGSRVGPVDSATLDAVAVQRLRAQGAIVIGKTNLHEFAYGATNVNPHFGDVKNPWRPSHIAGGSSGGSAAAVAAREVGLALGTDAAGSIRMPASLCGVVGLKPTFGLVDTRGLLASHNRTVDHIGPMTRSVEDAAFALEVLTGHSYLDASTPRDDLRGVRLGVPSEYFFDLIDPPVERVVCTAIDHLVALGASPVEVAFPDLEDMMPARLALFADGLAFHDPHLRAHPDLYSDEIRRRLLVDHFVLASDFARATRVRHLIQQQFARALSDVDILVAPTTPIAAVPRDSSGQTFVRHTTRTTEWHPVGLIMLRLTAPSNLTGLPALSVPAGFTDEDLPAGLQLIARPFREDLLLRVARTYEHAHPWSQRRPDLPC